MKKLQNRFIVSAFSFKLFLMKLNDSFIKNYHFHYIFLLIEIFFEKIKEFDWIKLSQREDIMHNMA